MESSIRELLSRAEHGLAGCVSVIVPLYRTLPDRKLNPLLIRDAVENARALIMQQATPEYRDYLVTALEDLEEEVDPRRNADGVGFFFAPDVRKLVYFPFPVKSRVSVNGVFDIRDLVYVEDRWFDYWVLSVDKGNTRLFRGNGTELREVIDDNFPEKYVEQYQYPDRPMSDYTDEESKINQERLLQYMRHLKKQLASYFDQNDDPVILTGVEQNLIAFKQVNDLDRRLLGELHGNYENTSPAKLNTHIWEVIEDTFVQQNEQIVTDIREKTGKRGFEAGLAKVWRAARDGKGELLAVEMNFEQEAFSDMQHLHLFLSEEEAPQQHRRLKAVNDVIEMVLEKGGKVVFFRENELEEFGHIAVRRRY